MPSASAKLEKQASFEAPDSSKQILNVLEKKVRNLEKRKTKLDSYRQDDSEGKALNEDQKNAIKRYDEVIQTLEFAKELQKSFTGIVQDMAKAHKKQVKREQVERQGQEIQRLREMLIIQDVLNNMGLEHVRSCFLTGQHGAPLLTEENLNQLDELYKHISPSREPEEGDPSYEDQLTQASEHLLALSEGKNKEILGTTYKDLKDLIMKIHDCGFLNNPVAHQPGAANGGEEAEETVAAAAVAVVVAAEPKPEFTDEPEEDYNEEDQPPVAEIINSRASVETLPTTNMIGEDDIAVNQQRLPVHQATGPQQADTYFVTPYNNNNNNNARSSSSEFNFLQESQIDMDSPHMDPAVVVAHPMPSVPAMNYSTTTTENVPGYQSQHLLEESVLQGNSSSLSSTQFSQTSSTSTAAAAAASAPPAAQSLHAQQVPIGQTEFNQPIPSQTFTNQKFVTMQGMNSSGPTAFSGQAMYGQMEQTLAAQMGQNVVAGNLTPPSSDAGNVQGALPMASQVVGNEPKKHFMNANAVAFDTLNFKQTSGTMSSSPTPDATGSNNSTLQLSMTNNQSGHFTSTQSGSQQQLHSPPTSDLPSNDESWNKNQSPGSYPHAVTQQAGNFQSSRGFNGRGGRGGRGGRFGNGGGGRGGNNFGGGRGGNSYQNYRDNNQGYYQNFNRENYGSGGQNYSNGYKRGGANNLGRGGGGNTRGHRGNSNRGGNMRGGSRGGFNKGNPAQ